jgi:aminopeptidase N
MRFTTALLAIMGLLLVATGKANARHGGSFCEERRKAQRVAAKPTTLGDLAEDDYDIKHLEFRLRMSDTSIYVTGNVATTAVVVAPTMNDYVFELSNALTIDSARVNGWLLPVTTSGNIRRITMPITLAAGSQFTARIWYHGMPPAGTGGFFNGITHTVSSGGTDMVYTVSDPWVALNWWPCKQSVLDQADSVDMFVTVPDGVVDGSNGKLVNVDKTSEPGSWTYHWKTNYPIDYYLISLAIARYSEYGSYMQFDGSTDTMLIQNFFMDTATFNPAHKAKFDSVSHMINYFSSLFGRYPFWQEKFGMCFTTLPGGMEHQTMVTIGVTDVETIAHELVHQWFGDHVTYKSWRDMWLSEGVASYGEHLYRERFHGAGPARLRRLEHLNKAISRNCGRTLVDDTATSTTLFTYDQYYKASMILHTLRYMAPHDSVFFKTLRVYQSTYRMGNASTADFQAVAESVYGRNLDTFFNQWIYGYGFPVFRTTWNQVGNKVIVKLVQTRSCSTYNNHFYTPVQLQFRAGTLDTVVKVYNTLDTQTYVFDWAPTVTSVLINPDVWTLMRSISVTKDASLTSVGTVKGADGIRVHPNPAGDFWEVESLPVNTALCIMDMSGRVLWQGYSNGAGTRIPARHLAPGSYMLRLTGAVSGYVQLQH